MDSRTAFDFRSFRLGMAGFPVWSSTGILELRCDALIYRPEYHVCRNRRKMLTLAFCANYTGRNMLSSAFRTGRILVALVAMLLVSPVCAQTCRFIGGPQFGGIEPPLAVDGACTDPDYNEKTF